MNMETLKIVKGQPFVLWVPTIMLNANGKEEIDAGTLQSVDVNAVSGCDSTHIVHHPFEHWLVLEFPETLAVGPYGIKITGGLASGRTFSLALSKAVEIVSWDKDSNWDRYIIGDHVELTDAPFITGVFYTDAELEALKEEWREKIAEAEAAKEEAEAAKEEWERKVEELEDVAKETTSQQILSGVGETAKQGSDPTATNTEIKQLIINEGIERAHEYAEEIHEIIGDWSNE